QKEETARVVAQKKVAKWLQNAASEQVGQKPAELASEEAEEKKEGHADADAEPEWRQEEQEKLRQQEEGTAKKVAQKKVQEWQQRALEAQSRADAADCRLAEKKEEAARLQKEEAAREVAQSKVEEWRQEVVAHEVARSKVKEWCQQAAAWAVREMRRNPTPALLGTQVALRRVAVGHHDSTRSWRIHGEHPWRRSIHWLRRTHGLHCDLLISQFEVKHLPVRGHKHSRKGHIERASRIHLWSLKFRGSYRAYVYIVMASPGCRRPLFKRRC
ncbi:unnamed protein product, partial [Durusdinium trenchii]